MPDVIVNTSNQIRTVKEGMRKMMDPIGMHEVGKARRADVLRGAETRRMVQEARAEMPRQKRNLFARLNPFNKKKTLREEARPGRLATEQ